MPDSVANRAAAAGPNPAELRRCIRDLVALSTLPALWTHADPVEIAESLGEALLAILGCEFVYIRLEGKALPLSPRDCVCARGLRRDEALMALQPLLEPHLNAVIGAEHLPELRLSDGRKARISAHWFGHGELGGMLVAGSPLENFPTELQRLALGVAVNQAATTLQRQEAEHKRRESERRFEQFMENVPGLAWIKDAAGRYVYANAAIARTLGRPAKELLSRTDRELVDAQTAQACEASDRLVVEGHGPIQALEVLKDADGRARHMLVTKFPIPGIDAGTVLMGGIAIDATERIEAEEALRESDRRKDEFLAMLAHELRNPLAPVRNAAQILKLKTAGLPDLAWAAEMIERQTAHMTRLIDDLLDVSRITRGAIVLKKERVVLQDIARSVVEAVRALMDASGHTFDVALPATPLIVEGDATRLSQVLSNLLNNAAKYTPPRGRISLEAAAHGPWVEVRVRDNGIGIPPAMLGRVFELFVQVDNSLERAQSGLGIGLTMVKRLVELHGGTVLAQSGGERRGTTMTVRLPMAPAGAVAAAGHAAGAGTEVHCRVLVVDDNHDAAASLGTLLELCGCEVRLAYDGREAVGAFSLFQPDLVVLDIGLPRMNGYEVVRQLRALPAGQDAMCIALTGFGKEEDRSAALAAGFDFHLTKPVAFERLQEALAKVESRRRARAAASVESPSATA